MVPDLASVSRGDLLARYDAVIYTFELFRDRTVLAGLPASSSEFVANEVWRPSGSPHDLVLGPVPRGSAAELHALTPHLLADQIVKQLDRCRGPWAAVDPLQWLEFRHYAQQVTSPHRWSEMAS
ncbi:hypothetical protein JWS13_12540 [Rhodococcus pseudokoreensis]|uniref:Uncharacterized protein n=1 Tax=Rhodococcus pseudokoreensis TaxID=2811421 RepID=A0A974W1Y3_9NOCA|nr:hypothetical protein [Rhodococcus pseudokoreensis]QSE89389.1 hypothetical protein JWS13_12540 [Rhodococcus pseudokoreensis]